MKRKLEISELIFKVLSYVLLTAFATVALWLVETFPAKRKAKLTITAKD